MSEREKYAKYLCSPEWWSRRNAVMQRSSGKCEKCKTAKADHVHHLTYIRKYNESLDDLQAVCEECHKSIHNPKTEAEPEAITGQQREEISRQFRKNQIQRLVEKAVSLGMFTEASELRETARADKEIHEAINRLGSFQEDEEDGMLLIEKCFENERRYHEISDKIRDTPRTQSNIDT